MAVRAKVRCTALKEREVEFETVYEDKKEDENQRFTKATPWGEIKLGIDNPEAMKQFYPGKEYYVDFTPAGEQE
jgi:hypothetical protein